MASPTRLELARATYARALGTARARNDSTAWRRLVRAGQNLREVLREAEGEACGTPRSRPSR